MKKHIFWRLLASCLALGAIFVAMLVSTSDDANASVFSHKYDGCITSIYTDKQGNSIAYYLYVPHNYNPQQRYPLVLLHGGGERGKDERSLAQNRSLLLNDAYANI